MPSFLDTFEYCKLTLDIKWFINAFLKIVHVQFSSLQDIESKISLLWNNTISSQEHNFLYVICIQIIKFHKFKAMKF